MSKKPLNYEQIKTDIFPALATEGDFLSDEAVVLNIAGEITVYFIYSSSTKDIFIERNDFEKWQISVEQLAEDAGFNSGEVTPFIWNVIKDGVLYQYPEKDSDWVAHVLNPLALLEHNFVNSSPILMVVDNNTVFLTDSETIKNIQQLIPVIITKPLMLTWTENEKWETFSENSLN